MYSSIGEASTTIMRTASGSSRKGQRLLLFINSSAKRNSSSALSNGSTQTQFQLERIEPPQRITPQQFHTTRFKSTSRAYLAETVREALKNSNVLENATKPNSKLWEEPPMNGHQPGSVTPKNGRNGYNGISYSNGNGNASHATETTMNGTMNGMAGGLGDGINDPIRSAASVSETDAEADLIHVHDPLNEWYLDELQLQPNDTLSQSPAAFTETHNVRPYDEADPFELVKTDIQTLSESIRSDLLGTDHPLLNRVASYFFDEEAEANGGGKKVRPVMVMLLSKTMAAAASPKPVPAGGQLSNTHTQTTTAKMEQMAHLNPLPRQRPDLPQTQRRLAEISEMIHTASLFHDDVIDKSDTRRNRPAVHTVFGNKMAILAGDYLLARASISLARLRNVEVVETMSTIIEHLVRGEVMQMKPLDDGSDTSKALFQDETHAKSLRVRQQPLEYYLRKNFYKTASLMANSCKSTALLSDAPDDIIAASYRYGKHVGLAFQLVDDYLDYTGDATSLGKPLLADLHAGLSTAPVLFASSQSSALHETLQPLMARKFCGDGERVTQEIDVETAVQLVRESDGLELTKRLAWVHVNKAIESIVKVFPEASVHRDALIHLAFKVVDRTR